MEPLKLWLKNKHFAQSSFKENRVVWNESIEKAYTESETQKLALSEYDKLTNLEQTLKAAEKKELLENSTQTFTKISQAKKELEDIYNSQTSNLENQNKVNEIKNRRIKFEEKLKFANGLTLAEAVARQELMEKLDLLNQPNKKAAKPKNKTIAKAKKASNKTAQETDAVIAEDAERNAAGGQGSPDRQGAEEAAADERVEKAKKSTDTVKTTKIEASQEIPNLSFPIAIADLKKLKIELGSQKTLSTLESTHDLSKGTFLLFPKPESSDKSIYLKISDTETIRLNGVHNPSNATSINAKEYYEIVKATINGYTQIIGAKKSKETKDPSQPEGKVVDENKPQAEIEKPKVGVNTPEIANIIDKVSKPYAKAPRNYNSTDETKTAPAPAPAPAPALAPKLAAKPPSPEVKNAEPDQVKALSAKAVTLYTEGKYEEAIATYEQAFKIEPVPELIYNIAYIQDYKLEQKEAAVAKYEEYIQMPETDSKTKTTAEARRKSLEDELNANSEGVVSIGKATEKPRPTFELTPPETPLDKIHDTVRIVENSELGDTLNHNPKDWNKLYDRLTYRELYNYRFEKNFGLSKTEAPQALLKAFQEGLNDQLQFEDLLATTATSYKGLSNTAYREKMDQLKSTSTQTYQQYIDQKVADHLGINVTEEEKQNAYTEMVKAHPLNKFQEEKKVAKTEFDAMQTLFNAGHDILTHLKKEDTLKQLAETKFEGKEEKTNNILDKIELPSKDTDFLGTEEHEFIDAQGIKINLSGDAFNKFRENFEYKGVSYTSVIQLLSRAYTLNELIAQEKVTKTAQGDIIITALPDNFDPKNPKIQELAAAATQETLGTAPEFGQVDAPTLEQSHAERVTSFRNSLSKDAEIKRAQILKQLLAAKSRSQSDIVETSFDEIADFTSEITLEDDQKHELIDEVITQTSPEAMANNLFDRPTVKGYQLFTIDRQGNKKINEQEYRNYFNQLMDQGEQMRLRQKFQEKPNINVGETTEAPMAEFIKENQSTFDLSDAQIDALRLGYAHELIIEKHQQNKEYQEKIVNAETDTDTKKFHQALYTAGYPKDKPLPSRETIAAAIGVLFKRGDFKAIAAGVNLPLGEGFSLHIGADNIQGPELGVNLTGQIYKDSETRIEGGAAINIPLGRVIFRETPAAPRPQFAAGAKAMFKNTEKWDAGLFATTVLGVDLDNLKNSGLDVAAIGFAAEFNQDRARLEAFKRINKSEGFQEIEAETDPQKRLDKIKAHTQFSQFNEKGKELPDADQLAIYEEWANQIAAQAEKQATPDCPITGVYAGFTVGIPPTLMLGFKIRIGDKIYFRPTRSERERIAKDLEGERLDSALDAISYQSAQGSQVETFKSADFFIDEKGSIALREKSKNGELTVDNNSALEKVEAQLHAQNLELIPAEKGGLELRINNTDLRNVRLQLDPTATDIQMRIDQTTGKTYLFGNLNKLIIDRSTFRYQRREQEGGANTFDVITISNKPDINPYEISQSSALFAEKRIVDDKRTQWEITKGANYNQFTNLRSFNPNEENLPQTTSFFDTIAEKPEWTEIKALATMLKSPTNREKTRDGWNNKITELFSELKSQIESGKPNIADYNAIVELVNDKLEGAPEMNATEAAKLLTTFQDLYFTDLLEKAGNDKEKLLETFNENNHWIVEKVLIPEFEKAITRLGIDANARDLALALKTKAQGKFAKMLSEYEPGNGNLKDFLEAKAKENRTPHLLFKSGTAIRETGKKQEGLLSGVMVSDLEALGGLYLVDDIHENPDLEKVVTEIMLPRPSLTVEGLATPTALKLAAFEGTGAILGLDTYRKVVDYYNSETKEINNTNKAALEKFVNLTHNVIDGKEPKIDTIRAALYGTYFKCGNLSLAAREQFTYKHETGTEGGIYVIGGEQSIHDEKEVGRDTVEILAGAAVDTKQEQPAPQSTPKNPASRPQVNPKAPAAAPGQPIETNPVNRPNIGAK